MYQCMSSQLFINLVCSECEGNLSKISKLQQDLSNKEGKWNAALTKLQDQVIRLPALIF